MRTTRIIAELDLPRDTLSNMAEAEEHKVLVSLVGPHRVVLDDEGRPVLVLRFTHWSSSFTYPPKEDDVGASSG
jgi:hypothetical protein